MTLGGLALAVGILVDDATVEIENVHRNMAMRKPLVRAILDGAQQIAVPAFVATLCICIVFVPVVFISGRGALAVHAARHGGRLRDDDVVLPLADARARRWCTTCCGPEIDLYAPAADGQRAKRDIVWRDPRAIQRATSSACAAPTAAISTGRSTTRARRAAASASSSSASLVGLFPSLGTRLLPPGRRGADPLPRRAPSPARASSRPSSIFARVEDEVHERHPAEDELETVIDNIGLPISGINLTLGDPSMISSADGEVSDPAQGEARSSCAYVKELRRRFPVEFPDDRVLLPRARHHDAGAQLRADARPSTCRSSVRS